MLLLSRCQLFTCEFTPRHL